MRFGLVTLLAVAGLPPAPSTLRAQENPVRVIGVSTLAGPTSGSNGAVDLAVNRSGDGVVAGRLLVSSQGGVSTYSIFVQRLRRGEAFGAPSVVGTAVDGSTGVLELLRVRVAIDDRGTIAVVWDGADPQTGWLQPWLRVQDAGGAWSAIERVSTTPIPQRHEVLPDVALGAYPGELVPNVYVVWADGTFAGASRILYRRYRVLGGTPTPALLADAAIEVGAPMTSPNEWHERPAVAVDATGAVGIVWRKYAEWAPGSFYWRVLYRRRVGPAWQPVYDPQDPTATSAGFVNGEYAVSSVGDTGPLTGPASLPRLTIAPDGRGVAFWRRGNGAPFGYRLLLPGPAWTIGSSLRAWQPPYATSGHRLGDVALANEGSIFVAWESLQTANGISGRILLSRLRFAGGATVSETVLDNVIGPGITTLELDASDTGEIGVAWTRGNSGTTMIASRARVDAALVAKVSTATDTRLHLSAPGAAGLAYTVWPLALAGTPASYAALPLDDGRSADFGLDDPLLSWFILTGGAPLMIDAVGTLDASGAADVPLVLPVSLPPVPLQVVAIAFDPSGSLPAALRLFTQPLGITLP